MSNPLAWRDLASGVVAVITFFAAPALSAPPGAAQTESSDAPRTRPKTPASASTRSPAKPNRRTRAEKALVGTHPLTLQWLSWKKPGEVTISDDGERLVMKGVQETADGELIIEGDVREVKSRSFVLVGEVTLRVNFLDEGKACTRKGVLHFRRTGKRKYWRMREMDSPCGGGTTDYVDVYVRKVKPAKRAKAKTATPGAAKGAENVKR